MSNDEYLKLEEELMREESSYEKEREKETSRYKFSILPALDGFNSLLSSYDDTKEDFEAFDRCVKNNDLISLYLYQARKEYFNNQRNLEDVSNLVASHPGSNLENIFKSYCVDKTIIHSLLRFFVAFTYVDEDSVIYEEYSKIYANLVSVNFSKYSFYKDKALNTLKFLEDNKNNIKLNIPDDIQVNIDNKLNSKMNSYKETTAGKNSKKRFRILKKFLIYRKKDYTETV